MSATPHDGLLEVPGATLFYQRRGAGPVLLVLQGGAGDADGSDGLADYLADRYTTVTYDRRGLSRSSIDGGSRALSIETHRDDVHRFSARSPIHRPLCLGRASVRSSDSILLALTPNRSVPPSRIRSRAARHPRAPRHRGVSSTVSVGVKTAVSSAPDDPTRAFNRVLSEVIDVVQDVKQALSRL